MDTNTTDTNDEDFAALEPGAILRPVPYAAQQIGGPFIGIELLGMSPSSYGLWFSAVAIGYAIGAAVEWLWHYLELRLPAGRVGRWLQGITAIFCAGLVIASLAQTSAWQNSVRAAMGAEPVDWELPSASGSSGTARAARS